MSENPIEAMFRNSLEELPENGKIVIAELHGGKREQCEFLNGVFYVWRYKNTGRPFGTALEVYRWRGCTGFDF